MNKKFKITDEYIKLDQLLKVCDIVGSGGHAKIIILEGEVMVNGDVATQRGKKIRSGDVVKVGDIEINVE